MTDFICSLVAISVFMLCICYMITYTNTCRNTTGATPIRCSTFLGSLQWQITMIASGRTVVARAVRVSRKVVSARTRKEVAAISVFRGRATIMTLSTAAMATIPLSVSNL